MEDALKLTKRNNLVSSVVGFCVIGFILLSGGALMGRSITTPINRAIGRLREGAGRSQTASQQFSSASRAMAEGASSQAASLEETSSSLEEMSSMTKRNAETGPRQVISFDDDLLDF